MNESSTPAQMAGQTVEPLRRGTARAALASGGVEVTTRVMMIVLSIVTARTLEPREVGILGLSVIVVGVVSMIGFCPETAAVAARGDGRHSGLALSAAVTRCAVLALLLALVWVTFPFLAAYLVGKDDGVSQLKELLAVMVWLPALETFATYPQVILQRRLDLSFLAVAHLLQPLLFVGLATVLLMTGHGYMGVAWAGVIGTGSVAVLVWSRAGWRRWLDLQLPESGTWRETWRGSVRVFVGGFGGYLGARLDNLLVAGALGPAMMGFYSMAWNASRMPASIFSRAITFVLIPTFARIQDDPERMQRGIRECLQHSYLILAPVCAVLFVCAPELVTFVIGPKWLPLVPALRVMCFAVFTGPLLDAANALLVGTGRAHLTGIATTVRIVALLAIMPWLARQWGVFGAAFGDLASAVASAAVLIISVRLAMRRISWPIAGALGMPLAAAVCAAFLAWTAGNYLPPGLWRLAVQGSTIFTAYLLIVATLGGRGRLFELAALLHTSIRREPMGAASRA